MKNKTATSERRFLNQQEVRKLLSAARAGSDPERDYCLVYMAFIHGLRVTELRSIRLSDVDMAAGSVYIRRLKSGTPAVHSFAPGEKAVLRRWLAVRAMGRAAGSDWLFPSHRGGPFSRQRIHVIIEGLGRRAGLSVSVSPHMLRHSCGFALAERGLDTRQIQNYLGHRSIRYTVRYTADRPLPSGNVWS